MRISWKISLISFIHFEYYFDDESTIMQVVMTLAINEWLPIDLIPIAENLVP